MLSCCQYILRGITEAVDCVAAPGMLLADASPACDSLSTSCYGAFRVDLIDRGNGSLKQACVGAAPGMLLADASPALDSLSTSSHGAFRVDLIDRVDGSLKHCEHARQLSDVVRSSDGDGALCRHGASRVDLIDHAAGSLG